MRVLRHEPRHAAKTKPRAEPVDQMRQFLGVIGARVVGEELPIAHAADQFNADGHLTNAELRARLAVHVELLVAETQPALAA